jgi:hypothetical protein
MRRIRRSPAAAHARCRPHPLPPAPLRSSGHPSLPWLQLGRQLAPPARTQAPAAAAASGPAAAPARSPRPALGSPSRLAALPTSLPLLLTAAAPAAPASAAARMSFETSGRPSVDASRASVDAVYPPQLMPTLSGQVRPGWSGFTVFLLHLHWVANELDKPGMAVSIAFSTPCACQQAAHPAVPCLPCSWSLVLRPPPPIPSFAARALAPAAAA